MKKRRYLLCDALKRLWLAALLGSMQFPLCAQREYKTLNDGWKFLKGECIEASDSAFNDSGWESVNLPHTWNADAYAAKNYYRGPGWYRKSVVIPQVWAGKQVFLK